MKLRRGLCPLSPTLAAAVTLALALMAPRSAHAEVIFAFGDTQIMASPPADLGTGRIDPTITFPEGYVGNGEVTVNATAPAVLYDVGDLPCTMSVTGAMASDFVVQNTDVTSEDILVLDGPILGVATEGACYAVSTPLLGLSSVTYPSGAGYGLGLTPREGDGLELFPSGRTVFHRLAALSGSADWDGYRIITRPAAEGREANLSLSCRFEGRDVVRPGETRRIVWDLAHEGGASNALDPQIVLRYPPGTSLGAISGPFACDVHVSANAAICTHESVLPIGEVATLEMDLRFDTPPAPAFRVQGFGSGAMYDRPLENNECHLLFDTELPDGGIPVPDGGASIDGGAEVPDGGGSTPAIPGAAAAEFRGGGGCACGVVGGRPGGGGPSPALLAGAVAVSGLTRRLRSGSRRRRDARRAARPSRSRS